MVSNLKKDSLSSPPLAAPNTPIEPAEPSQILISATTSCVAKSRPPLKRKQTPKSTETILEGSDVSEAIKKRKYVRKPKQASSIGSSAVELIPAESDASTSQLSLEGTSEEIVDWRFLPSSELLDFFNGNTVLECDIEELLKRYHNAVDQSDQEVEHLMELILVHHGEKLKVY